MDSVEKSLQRLEGEFRRVAQLPGISGGAPMSAEFLLSRILEIVSGWSPGVGGVTEAQFELQNSLTQALAVSEIKGWPSAWPDTTDLATVNAWFDDVGTCVTTREDIAGESLEAIPYDVDCIKCVTDAVDEGFSQVFTYSVEPRFSSGFVAPPIAFLIGNPSGPPDVTAKLVNSDSGETEAELVELIGNDWGLYIIRGHMCSGTSATLQFTKDTSGTFYVVPLGRRPTVYRAKVDPALVVSSTSNVEGWTDVDLTSAASALAFLADLTANGTRSASGTSHIFIRAKGGSGGEDDSTRVLYYGTGPGVLDGYATYRVILDDQQRYERDDTGGTIDEVHYLWGWWEWA